MKELIANPPQYQMFSLKERCWAVIRRNHELDEKAQAIPDLSEVED